MLIVSVTRARGRLVHDLSRYIAGPIDRYTPYRLAGLVVTHYAPDLKVPGSILGYTPDFSNIEIRPAHRAVRPWLKLSNISCLKNGSCSLL